MFVSSQNPFLVSGSTCGNRLLLPEWRGNLLLYVYIIMASERIVHGTIMPFSPLENTTIIKMYIYHALINTLSVHMIHINLNTIFYIRAEYWKYAVRNHPRLVCRVCCFGFCSVQNLLHFIISFVHVAKVMGFGLFAAVPFRSWCSLFNHVCLLLLFPFCTKYSLGLNKDLFQTN